MKTIQIMLKEKQGKEAVMRLWHLGEDYIQHSEENLNPGTICI